MSDPLAYFITFRTYSTWLPGDSRGAVDDRHNQYHTPRGEGNELTEVRAAKLMRHACVLLSRAQRAILEQTFREVCTFRQWHIHALNVRTNHVHIVVWAPKHSPERVMNDLKVWGTRRLREAGLLGEQPLWGKQAVRRGFTTLMPCCRRLIMC